MNSNIRDLIAKLPENRKNLIIEVLGSQKNIDDFTLTGARSIELATEKDLVFCNREDEAAIKAVLKSRAKIIICNSELKKALDSYFLEDKVFLITPKPRLLMCLLLAQFEEISPIYSQKDRIHPQARIAEDVKIGPGVVIGPDVEIGRGCVIGPNTVIDRATIGKDCRIGFNCSIGGEGFGHEVDEDTGEVIKFPHFGRVIIGDRVELCANCGIARGTLKDTILEDDVKLDNLVHVAHNCHVKKGALLTANAMLAGGVVVGEYAWIAPNTALNNGIIFGRCSMTGLGASVTKSVGDNELVVGVPARKLRDRYPADHPLLKKMEK